jgi:hypothetical protein
VNTENDLLFFTIRKLSVNHLLTALVMQHGMGQQIWYLRRGATTQYSLRNMYDGELRYGKRHGYGTFFYANGARYEGEWKDDVKSGKVLTYKINSR